MDLWRDYTSYAEGVDSGHLIAMLALMFVMYWLASWLLTRFMNIWLDQLASRCTMVVKKLMLRIERLAYCKQKI